MNSSVAEKARWRARHIAAACAALLIPAALAIAPGVADASVARCDIWTGVPAPNPGAAANALGGVSSLSPCNVWAVGYYQDNLAGERLSLAEFWNGSSWTAQFPPSPDADTNVLQAVSASSLDRVWAVGNAGSALYILQWNGSAWTQVPSPAPGDSSNLAGVAAVSDTNAWAVGEFSIGSDTKALVLHGNGTTWTRHAAPAPGTFSILRGVSALSARNVWAVGGFSTAGGSRTLIEHWNGTKWAQVRSANPRNSTGDTVLNAVAGTSASNVWAVGSYASGKNKTLIEHWNGRSWKIVASPSPGSANFLNSVTATSAHNAWAVGLYNSNGKQKTLILHWNGRAWSRVASPSPDGGSELTGVAATGSSGVWAVGDSSVPGMTRVLVAHCC